MNAILFAAEAIHLAAGVFLTGALFLLWLAGPPATQAMRRWEGAVLAGAGALATAALLSGLAVLALKAAVFEGRAEAAWEPSAVARVALETRFGSISAIRCALLGLLVVFLKLGGEVLRRADWLAVRLQSFALAAVALALMAGVSHAVAAWESGWSFAADAAHLLAAGLWAGALPALAWLLRTPAEAQAVATLRRFSRVALTAVIILSLTGLGGVWLLTGDFAALVGSPHGQVLLAKLTVLAGALALAAKVRAAMPRGFLTPSVWRCLAAEAVLAAVAVLLAAALRTTSPAADTNPVWPFSWRLVLDSGSLVPKAAQPAAAGAVVVALFCALLAGWRRRLLPAGLLMLASVSAFVAFRPSLVEAFPTSFARSPVAYSAASIAEGAGLYRTHCASCHGEPRLDGAARSGGAVELLATETAQRAAGEVFALISQGDERRRMPAFADALAETQRWSLVNYLRALANAGFCRSITTRVGERVEPDAAWLAAPDFEIAVGPLTPKPLRDLRGRRMALVVLYELPASRARLAELARRYGALSVQGLEIIAAPAASRADALSALGQSPPVLFPVVTEGAEAIQAAYRLFTQGAAHAELLIDRQGYLRAIWRDTAGLPDVDVIQAQIEALNAEKAPPPPPDDHIH